MLKVNVKQNSNTVFKCNYVMVDIKSVLPSPIQDSVLGVLVQVDKDLRHPLLLEQPSLQAAISSWHSDFELQEIFRKGETVVSCVVCYSFHELSKMYKCM